MIKKIISAILMMVLLCSSLPANATVDSGRVLLSQRFTSFAENGNTVSGLRFASGVDTRVVTDNGNKVLTSRAFGEGVKIVADNFSTPTQNEVVISAKIKITGEMTSGKLLSITCPDKDVTLLSMGEDGRITLADGKKVGGIPLNRYVRYSVVLNLKKSTINVWLDQKCVLQGWVLPDASKSAPKSVAWAIQNPNEGESSFFIDDIFIHDGGRLPWQCEIPSEVPSDEVLEYVPTTEQPPAELLKSLEFEDGMTTGLTIGTVAGTGTILPEKDEETGVGILRMFSDVDSPGGNYFDLSDGTIPNISRYIFDCRMKIDALSGGSKLPILDGKNKKNVWQLGYTLSNGAVVSSSDKVQVGTYEAGKWTRFSFAFDINAGKASVYIDGELTATNAISDTHFRTFFRYDLKSPLGGVFDVSIDYMRLYTGNVLRDLEYFTSGDEEGSVASIPKTSIMDPADKLDEALKGKLMFMTTNDTMYFDGIKQEYKDKNDRPVNINGSLMLPQNLLSTVTGKEVKYDSATGKITYGNAVMMVNNVAYTLNGESKTLSAAPTVSNGILYLPLRSVFEQIEGKVVTWDRKGLAIIGDKAVEIPKYTYLKRTINEWPEEELLYRYMQYDFPSGATMREALIKNQPNKQHPRLIFTPDDVDYILEKVNSGNEEWNSAYKSAIVKADIRLGKNYSNYYNATIPSDKQEAANQCQQIMEDIATAYLLTGDEKYAKLAMEILNVFVNWDSLDYNTGNCNLTIGHYAGLIAVGYDTFYNYMQATEDGRNLIDKIKKKAALELVFEPHVRVYGGEEFEHVAHHTITDNFQGVTGGGIMMLLCAVGDEEELKPYVEYLFENNMRSLAVYANLFALDGAYYEGMTYTVYGLRNVSRALTAMYNCFNDFYGFETAMGFNQISYAFTYMHSTHDCLAFSDSGSGYQSKNIPHEKWGYYFGDPVQVQMTRRQKLLSTPSTIESLFYYSKTVDRYGVVDISNQPLDKYFYGIESGTFRSSHEVQGPTFVGFHAGPTGVAHDMLDTGTFMFDANNVHWVRDLGPDAYSLYNYFNTYRFYRRNTEGENCILINPKNLVDENGGEYYGQVKGAQASVLKQELNKPRGAYVAIDLSKVYARDVSEYVRGYYFGDNRNTLIVQDELTLSKDKSELYWFMHTDHKIEILSNTKAKITTSGGEELICDVYCDVPGYELKAMDALPLPERYQDESQNKNVGITKLAVHIPSASGKVNIAVKLSPTTDEYEYTGLTFTPIDNWSVPDGEALQKATLSSISINGKKYDSEVSGMKKIDIEFPFGTDETPYIEAVAGRGEIISITQPTSPFGESVIVIDGENVIRQTILVDFTVSAVRDVFVTENLQPATPVEGVKGTLIKPINSAGQTIYDVATGPSNLIDDDFSTRYAQEGMGVWFEVDLGQVMDIKGIATSFYEGATRYQYYDVLYSEDGINFTKVWSGSSLGTTTEYESLAIPGRVRYIRVVGNKNSTSAWNSITELRAYK